jgi:hypothetical protein
MQRNRTIKIERMTERQIDIHKKGKNRHLADGHM